MNKTEKLPFKKHAEVAVCESPYDSSAKWYDFFNGDFSSATTVGNTNPEIPITYDCAICFTEIDGRIIGKKIRSLKFPMNLTENITDLKIWLSTSLPNKAEEANIVCQNVPITHYNEAPEIIEINFDEPHSIYKRDLYVGYSFTIKACTNSREQYPVFCSATSKEKAFYIKSGGSWMDISSRFGPLLLSVYAEAPDIYEPGDINYDNVVDVKDLTSVVYYVLDKHKGVFNAKAADIDKNNDINIVDVASISDIIVGRYDSKAIAEAHNNEDRVLLTRTSNGLGVSLSAANKYKAFQMDIVSDGELSIELNENLSKTHGISYEKISDGRYRVLCYSASSKDIERTSELFTINSTNGMVRVENILFATSSLVGVPFADVCESDITAVNHIEAEKAGVEIYTLQGIRVNKPVEKLAKGIYIIKGEKIIIK